MENIFLVKAESDGNIATDGYDIVIKIVDEKNALLADYMLNHEKLKSVKTLYYTANNCRCAFHYYDENDNKIEISPNETKELLPAPIL